MDTIGQETLSVQLIRLKACQSIMIYIHAPYQARIQRINHTSQLIMSQTMTGKVP